MSAPYRDGPARLACPRCGELLEVAGDAHHCMRCGGTWIAQRTIEAIFGEDTWPHGSSLWWRKALVCPVCARDGRDDAMTALGVADVVIDRCAEHGVWLDEGELARLLSDDDPRAARLRDVVQGRLERTRRPFAPPIETVVAAPLTELELDRAEITHRLAKAEQRREDLRSELRELEARIASDRELLRALEDELVTRD